jgi:small subunit ribosomal protein S18
MADENNENMQADVSAPANGEQGGAQAGAQAGGEGQRGPGGGGYGRPGGGGGPRGGGPRGGGGGRGPGGRFGGRGRGRDRYVPRRKVCGFCVDKVQDIDYKDIPRLRKYLSERAKIEPRRKTGTCARHQRALSVALKRARHMALLPYVGPHSR